MNWFIKFWIISSGICFILNILIFLAIEKIIKRDYIISKKQKSFTEIFIDWLRTAIFASIPFINILFALLVLFATETTYEKTIELLEKQDRLKARWR